MDADLQRDCQERGMHPSEYEMRWLREEVEDVVKVETLRAPLPKKCLCTLLPIFNKSLPLFPWSTHSVQAFVLILAELSACPQKEFYEKVYKWRKQEQGGPEPLFPEEGELDVSFACSSW